MIFSRLVSDSSLDASESWALERCFQADNVLDEALIIKLIGVREIYRWS